MGQVGVGEAANLREERRVECWHAHNVRVGRAKKSWCGEVNQRQRSVGLTAASVVYCGEFIIFSNKTKKHVTYL